MTLEIRRPRGPWHIAYPSEKLAARAGLPGAYGYDHAAHALRHARALGVPAGQLLAAALPCSWMVNARAPSPVFRRWLEPPLRDAWIELAEITAGGPESWLALPEGDRADAGRLVGALAIEGHGVAAVSKSLALLCPETVPLMDDAAIWFALDAVPEPATADTPTAGAEWFVPMLDWFAHAVTDGYEVLVPLARDHAAAPLDATQVLDRLLWFESWGYRLRYGAGKPRWHLADLDGREAIVPVTASAP